MKRYIGGIALKKISGLTGKRCIIAGLFSAKDTEIDTYHSYAKKVIVNSGGTVVGYLTQRRGVSRAKRPGGSKVLNVPMSSQTFIGKGKTEELSKLASSENANVVVFLNQLHERQIKNLSELTNCTVVDLELSEISG